MDTRWPGAAISTFSRSDDCPAFQKITNGDPPHRADRRLTHRARSARWGRSTPNQRKVAQRRLSGQPSIVPRPRCRPGRLVLSTSGRRWAIGTALSQTPGGGNNPDLT